jgi:transposase
MYYIGTDVGKDKLDIAFQEGQAVKTCSIENKEEAILGYIGGLPKDAHVVFEYTGVYHLTLAYLLKDKGIPFSILNPAASKGYANSLSSTAKTDKEDSKMLLRFGQERKPRVTSLPDRDMQALRQEIKEWVHCKQQLAAEKNHLGALLSWSGSSGKAIGSTEKRIGMLEGQIEELEEELFPKKPTDDNVVLATSIKGIGIKTATILLGFTNSLAGFSSPGELAKFIGLSPTVWQSGKSKGSGAIGGRGVNLLRSQLYNCAKSAKTYNLACKELYERLRAKGKPHKVAMIAVAHKLVRQFFAVIKSGMPYDVKFA